MHTTHTHTHTLTRTCKSTPVEQPYLRQESGNMKTTVLLKCQVQNKIDKNTRKVHNQFLYLNCCGDRGSPTNQPNQTPTQKWSGAKSFKTTAPKVWNNLPESIGKGL